MKTSYQSKSLFGCLIAVVSLAALLVIVNLLAMNVDIAEFVSYHINRHIAKSLGSFSSILPFSIFEVFIVICIVFFLIMIIYSIVKLCKRHPLSALRGVMIMIIAGLAIALTYSMLASFPYNRASIPLPYSAKEYNAEEINAVLDYYIDDFNSLSKQLEYDPLTNYAIPPESILDINQRIADEYKRLDSYNYFYSYTPKPKTIVNNWLMTQSRIVGITFLPTGESHYNHSAPPSSLPDTVAHELAHAKGVMREGDANMTAYYLLMTSEDTYLRYCAYMEMFWKISSMWTRNYTEFDGLVRPFQRLEPRILAEMNACDNYWSSIDSIIDKISSWMNDIYLKLNGASGGTDSYWDNGGTDTSIGDDGEIIITIRYSRTEKMFLYLYEQGSLSAA